MTTPERTQRLVAVLQRLAVKGYLRLDPKQIPDWTPEQVGRAGIRLREVSPSGLPAGELERAPPCGDGPAPHRSSHRRCTETLVVAALDRMPSAARARRDQHTADHFVVVSQDIQEIYDALHDATERGLLVSLQLQYENKRIDVNPLHVRFLREPS